MALPSATRRTMLKVPALALLFGCGARPTAQEQAAEATPATTTAPTAAGAFSLAALPYAYDALEPHIDAETMAIHHGRHHQAYLNNLNNTIAQHAELAGRTLEDLIANLDSLPESARTSVRNNGGGYLNHNLFWEWLSPNGGGEPTGDLAAAITATFGSFAAFKEALKSAAAGQFGSGWGWLVSDADGNLQIVATANQDNPITDGLVPLLGVDVWEHAYYLHYQNRRADYLEAFFQVINWPRVQALYDAARG